MKKRYLYTMLTMLMVAFANLCFTACGDDDDTGGDGTPTSGRWYLVTYNSSTCSHGEYIQFRSGKLDWNSRLGGYNTTYDCRISGTHFYLTNCSDKSYKDVSFSIEGYTDSEMVTSSSDGMVRTWRR